MIQRRKIAVLGAGTMGPGIATTYSLHGYQTALYSRTQETLDRAKEVIENNLQLFTEEHIITQAEADTALANVEFTTSVADAVKGAWYVAETIIEKAEPKTDLYRQLDAILPKGVIIASNTSYMDIFQLMPPERLPYTVIAHWYAPAHILPLVEIIRGPETLDDVMDEVHALHTACDKTAVRMEKYIPGFIVNRMQSAMTREVVYLIENGYCTAEDLDLAVKTSLMPRGLLLGLVERLDFTGLDMMVNSLNNKKFTPSPEPDHPAMVYDHYNKGEYGVKSGKGFYQYTQHSYAETLQMRDRQLLKSVRLGQQFLKTPLHDE